MAVMQTAGQTYMQAGFGSGQVAGQGQGAYVTTPPVAQTMIAPSTQAGYMQAGYPTQ